MQLKLITYKVVLRTDKINLKGEAPISIRCYQNVYGKPTSRFLSTNISINPKYWDKKNLKVKRVHPSADYFNDEIYEVQRKAKTYELEQRKKNGSFTIYQVHESLQEKISILSFTEFFAVRLEEDNKIADVTKRARRVTLRKVVDFNKGRHLYFDQLDFLFVTKFDKYLRGLGYHQNYIHKQHKIVKTYIRLASKFGLFDLSKSPYNQFTSKTIPSQIEFLMPDEVKRLENLIFDEDQEPLERVRDTFLLQCYLGFRFSDITRISKSMITTTTEGMLLRIKTEKTGQPIDLPIYAIWKVVDEKLSKPEAILQKYLNKYSELFQTSNRFNSEPFFRISNQDYNRKLKKLAMFAEIPKQIHSHMGRHTFTTLTANKIPLHLLQLIRGDSDVRTTRRYLHHNHLLMAEALKKADWG